MAYSVNGRDNKIEAFLVATTVYEFDQIAVANPDAWNNSLVTDPGVAIQPAAVAAPDDGTDAFLVTNPDNETDGGTLELDGPRSIVSAQVGGFTYVFVASSVDNGISVFRLEANGALTPVFDVTDNGTLELAGAFGLSTAMVDGNTYLFAAGLTDNGISVFRVNTNGSLTTVASVNDDATLRLAGAIDTATARVGASTYLFVAGANDNGVSTFAVAGDGRLTNVGNLADDPTLELAGVSAVATATIGATTFLLAGGFGDNGVSVFSVSAAGALTGVSNLDDASNPQLRLGGVNDITTVVIGGQTFVYVAGQLDNGISAFRLSAAGVLTNIDNETDTAATLFAATASLAVHVFGGITYLLATGNEDGFTLFRIESGTNGSVAGTLTLVENIADTGARELLGGRAVGSANVGGTSYMIGGGVTDDGVSTFGSVVTGQLWYSTEGNLADARIGYVNSDGGQFLTVIDNNPNTDLTTGFIESVAIDSAAGLYFALATGDEGTNAKLLMGRIGSSAAPTVVFTFDPDFDINGFESNLAFHIEINPFTQRLYIGFVDFVPFDAANQGIREFSYNPLTGAVSDLGFFVTDATANTPGATAGADGLFASQDMAFDTTRNVFYSHNSALGDGFETNSILRFSLTTPGGAAGLSVINQAQFALNGDGSDFTTTNGIIADIEIDEDSNRLYFITRSEDVEEGGAEDAIWRIDNASTAVNATAQKLTLVGITLSDFYPEDMSLDEVNDILYIESENSNIAGGGTSDVILVFQLNPAGTTATLINTIPLGFGTTANLEGIQFNHLVTLGALTATGTAAFEQGAAVDLLAGAPTIADSDGDHLASATVQVTGGGFVSNESSANGDDLGIGAGLQQTGTIAGTNITIVWNQAAGTLTLSGYDTFANYQAALNAVQFQSTGNNPTNYGLNPFRTITWTVSDGLQNIPGGSRNSGTTTVAITAVNDAPVNTVGGAVGLNEDATGIALAGMSISDPDANPALTDITVSFAVTQGTITLLTNVAGGIEAADVTGNGTATITVFATLNQINATLAAASGLTYTPNANYNGADTLTVVTNDGGNTGLDPGLTGNATTEQDSDVRTINIAAIIDAPVVIDATQTAATILEDQPSATGELVSALFGPSFSDAADQQRTGANPTGSVANTFAGIAIVGGSTAASGNWQYFNGAAWIDIGATSLSAARTIAAGTAIRFNPASNFNGPAPTLVAHLIDSGTGTVANTNTVNLSGAGATGGNTRYSAATVALSQDVTSVNDAPVIAALTGDFQNYFEGDAPRLLDIDANNIVTDVDSADFGGGSLTVAITAGGDAAEDVLGVISGNAITVDTVAGTVSFNGVVFGAITSNGVGAPLVIAFDTDATIAAVRALLTRVVYWNADAVTPTPGGRTIEFTLDDGDGTANGGDATGTATTIVTVFAINDAPQGTDATFTLAEDASRAFAVADFGFSDVDGNGFAGVVITTLPFLGDLFLNNVAITVAGTFVSATDIGAGLLTYRPDADGEGVAYATFTFQVRDDGGIGNGGQNTDQSANTITFDVTAVNDAPTVTITPGTFAKSGAEFLVNTATSGAQAGSAVTTLTGGGFVVTWTDASVPAESSNVKAQVFNAAGVAVGGEILINTVTAGAQGGTSIARLASGGFVVSWNDNSGLGGDASSTGIKAQIFDPVGGKVGGEFLVNTQTSNQQSGGNLVSLPTGGFLATWNDSSLVGGDSSASGIKAQFFNAIGGKVGGEFLVNATTFNFQTQPKAALLASGQFIVTWVDSSATGGDTANEAIRAQLIDATGAKVGGEFLVNTSTAAGQYNQSVTALTSGGFVVTWRDDNPAGDGSNSSIKAQIFDAAGGKVGGEFVVNTTTASFQAEPDVTALASGGFVVAWQDASDQGGDASPQSIKAQAFDAAGVKVGAQFLVNTTTVNAQQNPAIATLASGAVLVTWDDLSGQGGDASDFAVKGQIFAPQYLAVEQAALSLKGSVTIADVDAGAGILTATLSVGYGVLNITVGNSGATLVSGDGSGTVVVSGTIAQLNALLGTASTSTVTFTANTDAPPASTSFTVAVNDNGNTPTPAKIGTASATIAIASVNDAPAGTSKMIAGTEDTAITITPADFGFSDLDGNTLSAVRFTALPAGTLTYSGTGAAVAINTSYDLTGGQLFTYTPAANLNGTAAASLSFQVVDNGGTANGGVDTDPSANTLTFDLAAVNDAPINTVPGAQTVNEDGSFTLSTGNGNAIQVADVDATTLTVTLTVANGVLTLASTLGLSFGAGDGSGDITMTFSGTAAAINAALGAGLTYDPNANFNGSDSIAVFTTDNGQPGGPALTDSDAVAITVSAVNDAPTATITGPFAAVEQVSLSLKGSLSIADVDAGAGVVRAVVAIASGVLTVSAGTSGVTVVNNGTSVELTGTVAQINDLLNTNATSTIDYINNSDQPPATVALTLFVTDNGNTGSGGALFAFVGDTITITPVNDRPFVGDKNRTLLEDSSYVFALGDFNLVDPENNALLELIVDTVPLAGALTLNGVAVTAGQAIAAADIAAGRLVFTPVANANGATYASFTFRARDDGGTANGGVDTSLPTTTFSLGVTPVNDAPSGADTTVLGSEDDPFVFQLGNFGFTDAIDGNAFLAIRIVTFPANGTLFLDPDGPGGAAPIDVATIGSGIFISAADIAAGRLYFQPDADGFGTNYASFTFQVQDDGGTANGGQDLDQTANTITINITPDNTAPTLDLNGAAAGTGSSAAYTENAAPVILAPDAVVADAEAGLGDLIESASVSITGGLIAGADFLTVNGGTNGTINGVTFAYNGATGVLSLTGPATVAIYQALLRQVGFESTSNAPGTGRAIAWTVSDGALSSPVAQTVVTVASVNDAPVNTLGGPITIQEDATGVALSGMSIADPDADPASDRIFVTFQVANGVLAIRTDVAGGIVVGDIIAQSVDSITVQATLNQINATLVAANGLTYSPDANFNGADTLTVTTSDAGFSGSDPGLTGDGTSEEDTDTRTINVGAVDDLPTAVADAAATTADTAVAIDVIGNDTDVDAGPKNVVTINGATATVGVPIVLASGATATLNANGTISYYPNGRFDYLVSPATAAATGAVNSSAVDSFAYTLNGGSAASVTVAITGVDGVGDQLRGDAGANTITGTPNNDFFDASQGGDDTLTGLAGNDVFYFGAALTAADQVDGGEGRDVLAVQGNYLLQLGAGNLVGVETLSFVAGNDTRFGAAPALNSYLIRSVDENVAAGGQLIVNGGALLAGETLAFDGSAETDGSFLFYGGRGNDLLEGGANADIFYMVDERYNPGDRFIGGGGNDIVVLRGDYDVTLEAATFDSIETLSLASATDTRFFAETGALYSYDITTVDGNVAAGAVLTVNGGRLQVGEVMVFDGSAELDGSFRLFGGADIDFLLGGAGADLLFGGLGGDQLRGGAGADLFRYQSVAESVGAGRDFIADFTLLDLIDVGRIDANSDVDGDQAFTFLGAGAFTNQAGQVRVENAGGTLFVVEADVDGDGVADFQLLVDVRDGHEITQADFVL